jgi:hypothetical protein
MKRILNAVLILSLAAFASEVAQAKDPLQTTLMYTPDTIQVPGSATVEQVKRAIRKELYLKSWEIRETGAGQLQGQFRKGEKYSIVLDISFDAKTVNIRYKDSSGLNYGGREIHRTYNERVQDLEKAIRAELDAF